MSSSAITPETNPRSPSNEQVLQALTTPSVRVSALMTTILIFCTYTLCNAVLLSGLFSSSLQCSLWDETFCSTEESWILPSYALAKLHIVLLVGSLAASSVGRVWLEVKIGFLCSGIILGQLAGGMACLQHLNPVMAMFQTILLITLLLVLLFWISQQQQQDLQPGFRSDPSSPSLLSPFGDVPTQTLSLQLVLSMIQLADMAFGTWKDGYLGDGFRYVYLPALKLGSLLLVLGLSCYTTDLLWFLL